MIFKQIRNQIILHYPCFVNSLFESGNPDMTDGGTGNGGIRAIEKLQCGVKFSQFALGVVECTWKR